MRGGEAKGGGRRRRAGGGKIRDIVLLEETVSKLRRKNDSPRRYEGKK